MRIRLKQVAPFGFVGTGTYRSAPWHWMYYRKDHETHSVQFLLNGEPEQTIGVFKLTGAQFLRFCAGKLSLIPPGSCNPPPSGRPASGEHEILFKGHIKSVSHIMQVLGLSETYKKHKATSRQAKKAPFT